MAETGQLGDVLALPGTFLLGGNGVPPPPNLAQARVTQFVVETLRSGLPRARVTQFAIETLRSGVPKARVTQFAVETLRDSAVPFSYFVAATTALDVGSAGGQVAAHWFLRAATTGLVVGLATHVVHEVFASASTSLELTIRGSGRSARFLAVAATTGLELVHAIGRTKVAVATAATGVLIGQRARDAGNPNLFVDAASEFRVGSAGDYFALRTYFRNAETLFNLGVGAGNRRNLAATATTALTIFSSGEARQPIVFVAAATRLDVGSSAAGRLPTVFVAATTGLEVGSAAAALGAASKLATATTVLGLGQGGGAINTGKYVSASTRFTLRNRPAAAANFVFHVRATTAFEVLDPASVLERHAVPARASTGLALGHAAGQVRDLPTLAATVVELAAAGTCNGRDIVVSAITGMAMALAERSNQFVAAPGATDLEFAIDASAAIAGTPAGSGLLFVHRADAEVWLPWRRQTLTLPPGGQLPH